MGSSYIFFWPLNGFFIFFTWSGKSTKVSAAVNAPSQGWRTCDHHHLHCTHGPGTEYSSCDSNPTKRICSS
ncbi:hypothetical protein Bca101_035613 [Brassica carinata]